MLDPKKAKAYFSRINDFKRVTGDMHAMSGSIETCHLFNLSGRIYRPIHFSVVELVPHFIALRHGDNALMFMDCRILWTADAIREWFDTEVTINTSESQERGFRVPSSVTGAELSQHKFGRAIDFVIKGKTPYDVTAEIISNQTDPMFQFITRMEHPDCTPTWTHIDCANTLEESIHVFTTGKTAGRG